MDKRHRDFNKYLLTIGVFDALTEAFARLFLIKDGERPVHSIWFLQNCMDKDMDEDFIIKYDNLLSELNENRIIINNAERAAEKAKKEAEKEALKRKGKADPNANTSQPDPKATAVTPDPNASSVPDPNAPSVPDPNAPSVPDPNASTVPDPNAPSVPDPNAPVAPANP